MILNNPENRKRIVKYLENIDEDTFTDDFIIPFFSAPGYYLLRQNSHGPGEHGKDLIFYRNIPMFFENEYIVIQAKSQKFTTGNVMKFYEQIIRAFKTNFDSREGSVKPQLLNP